MRKTDAHMNADSFHFMLDMARWANELLSAITSQNKNSIAIGGDFNNFEYKFLMEVVSSSLYPVMLDYSQQEPLGAAYNAINRLIFICANYYNTLIFCLRIFC